eukprot:TRINITY_DN3343_c0_g2_i2.p1 TRINITY_DN3343_c0_g2~~TRINITY_DN3343_c0_g2_i2.p1  ORF type:complete len:100 (+),score=15.91 TRINITY_DN3343_c0_g2_i2:26-325(+)
MILQKVKMQIMKNFSHPHHHVGKWLLSKRSRGELRGCSEMRKSSFFATHEFICKLSLNLESLFFKDSNLSTVPVFMTFGLGLFVLLAMSCHLGLGLFEL